MTKLNRASLQSFAANARHELRAHVQSRLQTLGITAESMCSSSLDNPEHPLDRASSQTVSLDHVQVKQWQHLLHELQQLQQDQTPPEALDALVEHAASTWFNRLVALRFMETNGYLHNHAGHTHHIRILSPGLESSHLPEILHCPMDAEFAYTVEEQCQIEIYQQQQKYNELFLLLLFKQCRELRTLGSLFGPNEPSDCYLELLFTRTPLGENGLVRQFTAIPDAFFDLDKAGRIESIGWLYQHYNSTVKDEIFSRPATQKIQKKDIPAATQLFTPDWIIHYLTENSLGRLWSNSHKTSALTEQWRYYLSEAVQTHTVTEQLEKLHQTHAGKNPKEITLMDPSVGSGNLLLYAFDLLVPMYECAGYTRQEAARHIINHNLYGLDVDRQATQLTLFSLHMKAREYDPAIFKKELSAHIVCIEESNHINSKQLAYFSRGNQKIKKQLQSLILQFRDAKIYGSILRFPSAAHHKELQKHLVNALPTTVELSRQSIQRRQAQQLLLQILRAAKMLCRKYSVVIANPPYMGARRMNRSLKKYIEQQYPDSKMDLFAVFMEQCLHLTKPNGYTAMITQHAWMFLSSFESLRTKIMDKSMVTMAHLGPHAFDDIGGEVVQTTAFVIQNTHIAARRAAYVRLVDYEDENSKRDAYLRAIHSSHSDLLFYADTGSFSKIPGRPIAYWAGAHILRAFDEGVPAGELASIRQGLATGNNKQYLRHWYEVADASIAFGCTDEQQFIQTGAHFAPYNKGGTYRKWFGNHLHVIRFDTTARQALAQSGNKLPSRHLYFHPSVSWSKVSNENIACRYYPGGFLFDVAGCSLFAECADTALYLMGLLNSNVANTILAILSPTLNYEVGHISSLPVLNSQNKQEVISLVQENIALAKGDWDAQETSWEFARHPMITQGTSAKQAYTDWQRHTHVQFERLHQNEETLNHIFINKYGWAGTLSPCVDPKDISLTTITDPPKSSTTKNTHLHQTDTIKGFMSYAVGCMFGRYCLDTDGLAYAGGNWDSEMYETYQPVDENCIVITQTDGGQQDVVRLFSEFVQAVYGKENIEQNLAFIAQSLGTQGSNSLEKIRNYFYHDFYKDHMQRYKRRPIYWQLDSGKNGGYRALMYLHRYTKDTLSHVQKTLHPLQHSYQQQIATLQAGTVGQTAQRQIATLKQNIQECKQFNQKLGRLAPLQIELDLEDGVRINHAKLQSDGSGQTHTILSSYR